MTSKRSASRRWFSNAAFLLGSAVSAAATLGGPPGSGYSLLWSDEFTTPTLDPLKWEPHYSWGNALNHDAYLDPSQDTLSNGVFTMTAVHQRDPAAPDTTTNSGVTYPLNYTSGGADTSGKLGITSGYIEANMKMPSALGTWPAFWSLYTGWPPEIDIMEVPETGTSNTTVTNNHVTIHYSGTSGAASAGTTYSTPDLSAAFHTYGLAWSPTSMTFYFDGAAKYTTTDTTIISQMQTEYLILNLAVGGWGGTPNLSSYPAGFQVDYVKVWQTATPQATTWTLAGGGSWDTAANWSNSSPQLASSTATFAQTAAGAATITWSNSKTTGAVILTGTTNYTLGGSITNVDAESLMFATNTGTALLKGDASNGQGTHVINSRIEIAAGTNTIFHNDLTNPITINGSVIGGGTGTANLTSGAGTLTIEAGKFIFAGASNTWTGATTISAGATMQIGNGGVNASFGAANVAAITDNGTLVINTTSAFTLSNVITGSGGIVQAGTGTTTLSGNNTYIGPVQINAGTLVVTAVQNNPGQPFTIAANGTLAGNSVIDSGVILQSGGTLAPGIGSTAGTLFVGTFNTTGGGAIAFKLANTTGSGGVNDLFKVNGAVSLAGTTTISVAASSGALVNGTYNLVTYMGAITGDISNLALSTPANVRPILALDTSTAHQINLIVTGNAANLIWVGDGAANAWDAANPATNWLNGALSDKFFNWDAVNFTDGGAASVTLSGTLTPGGVFVNSTHSYTFAGSGAIAGLAGLSKNGAGTLVINTTNSYTGATLISGGIISVAKLANTGTNSPLGAAGNIILDGGTLSYTGPAQSTNRPLVLGNGGGTLDGSGSGALNFTNTAALGTNSETGTRTLTLAGSNGGTLAGIIVNGTGGATSLTKTGSGAWTLTGNNTYTGPTAVSAGTLILASNSTTTGAIASSSAITIYTGGTLKMGPPLAPPPGVSTAVSYGLGGTSGLFPGITINQGGTLTTTNGICALLGPVTLAGGTLASGTANSTSGSWDMQSDVTVSGGATKSTLSASDFILASTNATGTTTFNVSPVTAGGVDLDVTGFLSGLGNFAKSGTGVMQISGLSVYTGSTTINSGTLQFGASGRIYNAGNISAVITLNAATLIINNWSYGPTDGGNLGGDNFNPTDLIINGGIIQYTGATNSTTDHDAMGRGFTIGASGATLMTMTAGVTWNIDPYSATDTSFILASNGGTLTLGGVGNGSILKVIPGNGGVSKSGTGTWTLGATNTYLGATSVAAGTLNYSGTLGTTTAAGSINVGNTAATNAVLNILPGASITLAAGSVGVNIGTVSTAVGAINQTGGTLNITATDAPTNFEVGAVPGGFGYYKNSGGNVTVAEMDIGGTNGNGNISNPGGNGVVDITAGTTTVLGYLIAGRGAGSIGVLNITGGTVNLTGAQNGNLSTNWGGANTVGVINIANATVTGPANTTYVLNLNPAFAGASPTALGVVNLRTGGTLQIGGVTANNAAAVDGPSYLNFHGGTLKATITNASYLTSPNVTGVYIYGEGGTIDNNGANITISDALLAPTGTGVTTIPIMSGGSLYIGAPAVNITGGGGSGATAVATISNGVITGITVTNPGTNYTSAPTVTLVGGGGTGAVLGTIALAANTGGAVTFNGAGTTTLTGINTYSGGTRLNQGTLRINADAALGAVTGPLTFAGSAALQASANISFDPARNIILNNNITATLDDQGNQVTVNGVISGSGNFTKAGAGTIYLTNANTFSGTTTLNAGTGTLALDHSLALQNSTVNLAGGSLAFGAGVGNVTLGALNGTSNLSLADTAAAPVTLQVGNNNTPGTYAGALSGSGGLAKVGSAAWTLTGSNTYSGGTTVTNGQLIIANAAALPTQTAVTVTGGLLSLPQNMGQPFTPSSLAFGGTTASPVGTLDLKNNSAILPAANTPDQVRQLLLSGYANGAWTGPGLITSTAPAGEALGYLSASDYALFNPSGIFAGVTLAGTETLVKYTYQGDANLDGQINTTDYALLDSAFLLGTASPDWLNGDFNYDGVIDYRDYALIDYAYMHQTDGVLAGSMIAEHAAMFGQSYLDALNALSQSTVPEPTSLTLLTIGALTLIRRRPR